ncbi:hypothetical protein [Streptomyces luteogriseus]|uniref:hypothetical protein n=1 Tax=Streptomyces luteogriseus TaxID=68233 RepID=UPI0037F443A3
MLHKQETHARDIVTGVLDGQATAMTFGHGLHTCLLGAPSARLGSRVVLEQLLERFPELRLAPGYRLDPAPGLVTVRRPARLDGLL